MKPLITLTPASLAVALAAAGCGSHKIARSHTPAKVGGGGTPPATDRPGPAATGTFAGNNVLTKFGDVRVAITVRRGRITDVQYLKLPFDRQRSAYISQQAAPILRQEVLAAQTAHIDILSGATYTSDAWASSVASAIARAR